MALSNSKVLSSASLLSAMKESLRRRWGVKVKVITNPDRFKCTFYLLKKEFPEFINLSLLSTSTPSVFLIYHPETNGEQNGQDRLGKADDTTSSRDPLFNEQIL